MPKTGNQLSREFDKHCGQDQHVLLWVILRDVQSSYDLAMESADVPEDLRAEIHATIEDYLANNYGAA